jgi:hypothetical protein
MTNKTDTLMFQAAAALLLFWRIFNEKVAEMRLLASMSVSAFDNYCTADGIFMKLLKPCRCSKLFISCPVVF